MRTSRTHTKSLQTTSSTIIITIASIRKDSHYFFLPVSSSVSCPSPSSSTLSPTYIFAKAAIETTSTVAVLRPKLVRVLLRLTPNSDASRWDEAHPARGSAEVALHPFLLDWRGGRARRDELEWRHQVDRPAAADAAHEEELSNGGPSRAFFTAPSSAVASARGGGAEEGAGEAREY